MLLRSYSQSFPPVVVTHFFTAVSLQKEGKLIAVKHARLKLDVQRLGLEKEDRLWTGLHLVGWEEHEQLLLPGLVVIPKGVQTALGQIANKGLHIVVGKPYDLPAGSVCRS